MMLNLKEYFEPVILCSQNLGCNIVGSATESGGGTPNSSTEWWYKIMFFIGGEVAKLGEFSLALTTR